ncbi:DUF6292 family protein [Actinophytocola glycyrrhizae]|uniref:DUF6292 family protein n=1 Tax=Actinophytocola glycyrrhizae TaxID=2044873 RepID=A0ABV9S5X8_9PSEU
MTASLDIPTGHPHPALTALRAYLADVTTALGIGLESCTVDHDTPVSAYVALDEHLPGYPGHDTALLWDEVRGWSAAIETHRSRELVVIRHLGGSVVPPPEQVARFVAALRADDHRVGTIEPADLRPASGLDDLDTVLRDRHAGHVRAHERR